MPTTLLAVLIASSILTSSQGARVKVNVARHSSNRSQSRLGADETVSEQSNAYEQAAKHTLVGRLTACSEDDVPVTREEIAQQASLKDSNGWKNLAIGAATNYNYGLKDSSEYWYWQLFAHHFDLTTLENGCKMTQVMWNGPSEYGGKDETKCSRLGWHWAGEGGPMPMCYKFELCDSVAIDTIAAIGGPLNVAWRGHALIWGAPDSDLSWHPTMANDESALTKFIPQYVESTLKYYKGKGKAKAFAWDTVNEAVKDSATGNDSIEDLLKDNDYSKGLTKKYDYIPLALEAARAADPNVKIFYNDYRILWENDKSDAVYKLLSWLKNKGYPLDGIGFQAHLNFGFIDDGHQSTLKSNFKRFADLGLELHITELDIGCNFMSRYKKDGCMAEYDNAVQPEENAARQAAIYEVVLKACLETPSCTVFEMWGFTDYTYASLPYLFDCNGRPKDAYSKVLSLLKREDSSGCAEVAVVKYYLPTNKVVSMQLAQDGTTAISANSTSAGAPRMTKKKDDYISTCLTSGIWTLTLAAVYGGDTGWNGGSFSVETRDGRSLISTTTFDTGSAMSATFMVGDSARCEKPDAGDTGVDYSTCGNKKIGWKCTVGCQDGYTLVDQTQLFYCTASGYMEGTQPTCQRIESEVSSPALQTT